MLKTLTNPLRAGREHTRPVPVAFADAVEKWARAHGGHAKLKWLQAPMNCWAVILEYRVGDPRKASADDGEPVLLHEFWTAEQWAARAPERARRHPADNRIMPGYYAYELDDLGVEGVIARLDQGNILSGRGEFDSLEGAAAKARADNEKVQERRRESGRDDAGARFRDGRRQALDIPFLPVGIDLQRGEE